MNDREEIGKSRKPLGWFLASFGLLLAGLAGGAILHALRWDFAWTVPIVCFVGYLLAFRRGMLMWNPRIDRTWRARLRVKSPVARGDAGPVSGASEATPDLDATVPLLRRDVLDSRASLRVVR
jgi:hypothetical protein